MKYQSANRILPKELLEEIQKYIDGDLLYIPVKEEERKPWGSLTKAKEYTNKRNEEIRASYRQGAAITELADQYSLSPYTIRNILYRK
ncbi:hypothetical protein AC622_06255 [Bacillus sp. FJAT-27916]|uniref:CD3324 family protein n=1 Tax=Bacillaceae TaxID=186817 RepID=UPI00067117FA|nr:CD3324 family protein [Bacillus sp. FJAT-27916]KMY43904.1 hypothetical protein AC622_06255 [Bacillus sp. FJAT-27916]